MPAPRRVALHSRERRAIRIPKSASSARSGDEETTAKIEIYAPCSRDNVASTREWANKSRARFRKYTASSPTFSRTRLRTGEGTTCRNFRILCMAFRRRSMPTRRTRRGRIAPSPPRELPSHRPRREYRGSPPSCRRIAPTFSSVRRKSPGKLH